MDIILSIIGAHGVSRGVGFAVEYCGPVVEAMTMDERFTLCNLTIEMGAEYGLITPDETTLAYLSGRPFAPKGEKWERLAAHCRELASDPDCRYDDAIDVDITGLGRQITWGVDPGQVTAVDGAVPDIPAGADQRTAGRFRKAWDYMGYGPGLPMAELAVQDVFIGACSNGRLSHLRAAAAVVEGKKVAPGVRALVVPGSEAVKAEAEALGLDRIFREAGFQWGEPGCSLCAGSNGDRVPEGHHCVSTTNRNFIGRQGRGARTHLASPITAALAAIHGYIR